MTIRAVTHTQHQKDFNAGYDAKIEEIKGMGFAASQSKFNADYPKGYKPSSLGAYYYADGELAALMA